MKRKREIKSKRNIKNIRSTENIDNETNLIKKINMMKKMTLTCLCKVKLVNKLTAFFLNYLIITKNKLEKIII